MFINNALTILKEKDQKITKTRLWLLEKMSNLLSPINPYELLEQDPNAQIDITTIYRNLDLFEKLGIVHKVTSLGGYIPCSHNHEYCHKVHDMIICKSCHTITEVHIDPSTKKSFGLNEGAIELSGECNHCG